MTAQSGTWTMTLAALLAAGGCGFGEVGMRVPRGINAMPMASLSAADLDDDEYEGEEGAGSSAEEFPSGWGLRTGATGYLGATTRDVDPRVLIGAYYHFGENDSHRLEAGFELTPDLGNAADNMYTVLSGHYMGFIGDSGKLYWKAGGGTILETRGTLSEVFGVLEAGAGLWLEIGEDKGLFAGMTAQLPIGEGVNTPVILILNAGFDF